MLELGLYLCLHIVVSTRGSAGRYVLLVNRNVCVRHWNYTPFFPPVHEEKVNGMVIRRPWYSSGNSGI